MWKRLSVVTIAVLANLSTCGQTVAQEAQVAIFYIIFLPEFKVERGYKLESPDELGNNFVTCANEKMKVDLEKLQQQPGSCNPGKAPGPFAGTIDSIDASEGKVVLQIFGGGVVTLDWSAKAGIMAEFRPGDSVFFSTAKASAGIPEVGDAYRIEGPADIQG